MFTQFSRYVQLSRAILLLVISSVISFKALSSPFTFEDQFLKADEAFVATFKQQGQQVLVDFKIAPGYYLYQQQFTFQGNNVTFETAELPMGITHEDQYFGVQQIYREHLSFTLTLNQVAENAVLSIRYQGCADKGLCYPPTTKSISIQQTQ